MKNIILLGIGLQSHGRYWIPRINAPDLKLNYRVQWVWDSDAQEASLIAADHDAEAVDRPDAVLDEVDGAMITTPDPALYLKQAAPFLKRGMPVYVNRPMAGSPQMAREIVAMADDYGAPIATGSSLYFSSHAFAMREHAGQLGRLRTFVASTVAHTVYMYLPHAIAVMQSVLGSQVDWVQGFGRWDDDSLPENPINIVAHVQYARESQFGAVQGTIQYMAGLGYGAGYTMKLWGEKGGTPTINFGSCDIYGNLLTALDPLFVDRQEPMSHEDMLAGTDIHYAIVKSLAEQRRVTIAEMQGS